MENVAKLIVKEETGEEQSSMPLSESQIGNINTKIEAKFDKFTLDTEADNQNCMEISLNLEDKEENRKPGLFGSFSHCMNPNFEYIKLESEQSNLTQEVATKIINDRYKWIMENAERRKIKDEKDKLTFTQLSHNLDIEDVGETTQLLHNMHIISGGLADKDLVEDISDNHSGKINWLGDSNDIEMNTKANIPSADMLNTITEYHECTVEDIIRKMMNKPKDDEKSMTLNQTSQKLDTVKYGKTYQAFCDRYKVISSLHESDADECTQFQCGIMKGNDDFDCLNE